MENKTGSQTNKMMQVISIAGVIEIICILLNIGFSYILHKQYSEVINEGYVITMQLNDMSQNMSRCQNVLYGYIYAVSDENEDYSQEMEDIYRKIEEERENITAALETIGNEDSENMFALLCNDIDSYKIYVTKVIKLGYGSHDAQMAQKLSEMFKNINSNLGFLTSYVNEYKNECLDKTKLFESISVFLNIVIVIAAIGAVIISGRHAVSYGKELSRLKDDAETANNAKSAFLANMSHEIRTPINAVLSMDEMILRESNENEIIEYALDIKSAGQTLLSLINDILDISKIESGKMELIPEAYKTASIINDEYVLLNDKAKAKGLKIKMQIASNLPSELFGDTIRIKQIITNLLNNAIKYTEKGTVTLKITSQRLHDNEIALIITVSDTGIGIKEDDMQKLFSKFERIEEGRNKHIEGTGLGMSITKQLVELMDGEIVVDSKYGEGSTFTVKIPQRIINENPIGNITEQMGRSASSKYVPKFIAPNARILVVDDNEMNRKAISLLLKQTKILIDEAGSGTECLHMCENNVYDIIFLDHQMPGKDGVETFKELRQKPFTFNDDTPVIMLTANALSGAREEYLSMGFTDFISKPVEPKKLEQMIYKYLPSAKKEALEEKQTEKENITEFAPVEKPVLSEFDYDIALKKCLSDEIFRELAKEFIRMYPINKKKIEAASEDKKDDYKILVHALKSNARMVGLVILGHIAENIERSINNNISISDKDHEELMTLYASGCSILQEYADIEDTSVEHNEEHSIAGNISVDALIDAVKTGDIMEIDEIFCQMKNAGFKASDELEEAIAVLDFDKALHILDSLK